MSDMRLIVAGAGGRMGRTLIHAIAATDGAVLAGAVEAAASAVIGRDAGELSGLGKNGVAVTTDIEPLLARVAADHRRGGRLHRAGENGSVRCRNGVDEGAPHASAGPSHDQPHVGHGISPANLAAGIARPGWEGK